MAWDPNATRFYEKDESLLFLFSDGVVIACHGVGNEQRFVIQDPDEFISFLHVNGWRMKRATPCCKVGAE